MKVGEGPHPNLAAVTELAERVHHQLDMLGVPRRVDAGELTLLGRMAEWLTADARASVGGDLTTARDYLALPGVVGVQDCGASNLIVYVERGCSTDDAHWLSAHIGEHKAVNTLVAIERDRRVDERRQA